MSYTGPRFVGRLIDAMPRRKADDPSQTRLEGEASQDVRVTQTSDVHECVDMAFVRHLTRSRYHPRSNKHGDFACKELVHDLLHHSPALRKAAAEGKLVYQINFDMGEEHQQAWNIDLVLGSPRGGVITPRPGEVIRKADPAQIFGAVDAKGVMTEHGKARRNRQRDLTALHSVVHAFYPRAVAGGLVHVNLAPRFVSPLRAADDVTEHPANLDRLVAETVRLFEGVPRARVAGEMGLDAMGVFVVSYTNEPGSIATLVRDPPAPQGESPVHYRRFLSDFIDALTTRFPF